MSGDAFGKSGGNGEADALISSIIGEDRSIDANHFALEVDQRTTAIARIDRSIGLEKIFERIVAYNAEICSVFSGDNPSRDGSFERKGAADCQNPVADIELVGVAPDSFCGELGTDFQYCQIGFRIGAENPGRDVARLTNAYKNPFSIFNDVIIGDDVAIFSIDHHARTNL